MIRYFLIAGIGVQELLLLALIILLIFGGRKIPELMKGIGKGVRSFKEGMNENESTDTAKPDAKSQSEQPTSEQQKEHKE